MKPGIGALVGLLVVLTAATALAQDKDVTVAVKGGVDLYKFTQSGSGGGKFRNGVVGDSGSRTGWSFGGSVRLPIGGRISLQPEVFYDKRGGKDVSAAGTTIHNWSYVELPVLVNFALVKSGPAKVYAIVGPQIGARARVKLELNGAPPTSITRLSVGGDTGIVAGAGVDVKGLSLEGRWVEGMTDMITSVGHLSSPADGFGPGKVRNRQILVLVGYDLFKIKK